MMRGFWSSVVVDDDDDCDGVGAEAIVQKQMCFLTVQILRSILNTGMLDWIWQGRR